MGTGASRRFVRSCSGLVLAACLTGSLWPAAAEATTTRVHTLGVMNRYLMDDSNRWLFPHIITKYGNLFYLEMFGSRDSYESTAPGSNRRGANSSTLDWANAVVPPDMGDLVRPDTLYIADNVAVQQSAGGGAIIGITDDLFLSLHLSDYENPTVPAILRLLSTVSAGDPREFPWLGNGPPPPASANRKFDVFAAYNVQDLMQLGLRFTFGSSKYKYTPDSQAADVPSNLPGDAFEDRINDNIATSEFGFTLGGGLELSEAARIDLGIGMTFHSLTYLPNQRQLVDGGGGLEFRVDARAMIGVSEWWEVVPALTLSTMSVGAADLGFFTAAQNGVVFNNDVGREEYLISDVSASVFLLDLGVAGHMKPTDFVDFWGAVGFQVMNATTQFEHQVADAPMGGLRRDQPLEFSRDSYSIDATPYIRLALEAKIFSWLDFRGGVVKFIRADKSITERVDTNPAMGDPNLNLFEHRTTDEPFFDYFVGAAVHYEGFFLDLQVDPFWFKRGPEFISGSSTGPNAGNMFVNASLGYRFGEPR